MLFIEASKWCRNMKKNPASCEKLFDEIYVIFVQPLYEQNIGFIARSMKNFCLKNLIIVKPRCKIGIEAIKYSMHAKDVLETSRIEESFEELTNEFDLVICSTGKKGKSPIRRHLSPTQMAKKIVKFSGTKAIVIGREDIGLTNNELRLCDIVVTIDANPEYPILNASHAAAILFYEIFKHVKGLRGLSKVEKPSKDEINAFLDTFEILGKKLGYEDYRIEKGKIALRRLIGEGTITTNELRILFGYFRKSLDILQKCRR